MVAAARNGPSTSNPLSRSPARLRAVAAVAVIVAASTTPSGCQSSRTGTDDSSQDVTVTKTVIVIRADDNVCWTAKVDGKRRKGCGNAEFDDRSGRGTATVVKTTDGSTVRVRLVVDGRVVDRASVRTESQSVVVEQSSSDN